MTQSESSEHREPKATCKCVALAQHFTFCLKWIQWAHQWAHGVKVCARSEYICTSYLILSWKGFSSLCSCIRCSDSQVNVNYFHSRPCLKGSALVRCMTRCRGSCPCRTLDDVARMSSRPVMRHVSTPCVIACLLVTALGELQASVKSHVM